MPSLFPILLAAASGVKGANLRKLFSLVVIIVLAGFVLVSRMLNEPPEASSPRILTDSQADEIIATQKAARAANPPLLAPIPAPPKSALQNVAIGKMTWMKEGVVMLATFTFKNDNDFDVKDVAVQCDHSANSGTVIDRNTRTIYEVVKAHSTKTVRGFNMGFINSQAASTACGVIAVSRL